jgi:hypothetical protein
LLNGGADTVAVDGKGHVEPGIAEKGGWDVAEVPSKERDEAIASEEPEATGSCLSLTVGIEVYSTGVLALLGP